MKIKTMRNSLAIALYAFIKVLDSSVVAENHKITSSSSELDGQELLDIIETVEEKREAPLAKTIKEISSRNYKKPNNNTTSFSYQQDERNLMACFYTGDGCTCNFLDLGPSTTTLKWDCPDACGPGKDFTGIHTLMLIPVGTLIIPETIESCEVKGCNMPEDFKCLDYHDEWTCADLVCVDGGIAGCNFGNLGLFGWFSCILCNFFGIFC